MFGNGYGRPPMMGAPGMMPQQGGAPMGPAMGGPGVPMPRPPMPGGPMGGMHPPMGVGGAVPPGMLPQGGPQGLGAPQLSREEISQMLGKMLGGRGDGAY